MSDLTLQEQIELRALKRRYVEVGMSEADAERDFAVRKNRTSQTPPAPAPQPAFKPVPLAESQRRIAEAMKVLDEGMRARAPAQQDDLYLGEHAERFRAAVTSMGLAPQAEDAGAVRTADSEQGRP